MLDIIKELERFNPWWKHIPPRLPQPLVERESFETILKGFNKKPVQIINGLRQVGKTTLMYQLIAHILHKPLGDITPDTKPEQILYYSFDLADNGNGAPTVKQLIEDYFTHILAIPLMELERNVYIFLDEVHRLHNWSREVKYFCDLQPLIRFVITGSSSMHVTRGTGESLVGRAVVHHLYPFSFREYLAYRGIEVHEPYDLFSHIFSVVNGDNADVGNPIIPTFQNSEKLVIEFNRYVEFGGLPGLYPLPDPIDRKKEVMDRIDLTLFRDILEIFEVRQPKHLAALFRFLTSNSAQVINYSTLTNALKVKFETAKNYLDYLEHSHLIRQTTVYSPNAMKRLSKNPKIYLGDHSLFLLNGTDMGLMMETIAANHLQKLALQHFETESFYWTNKKGEEVDVVLETDKGVIPFEVKYRSSISSRELKGLIAYAREFDPVLSIVVTDRDEGITRIQNRGYTMEVLKIPLWKLLLST